MKYILIALLLLSACGQDPGTTNITIDQNQDGSDGQTNNSNNQDSQNSDSQNTDSQNTSPTAIPVK